MNTIPLIVPPSSPLYRMTPGKRPKLLMTVLVVLFAHVVFLTALLIQGCQRERAAANPLEEALDVAGPLMRSSSIGPASAAGPALGTAVAAPVAASSVKRTQPPLLVSESAAGLGAAKEASADSSVLEYTVKTGDSLSRIAKAQHTTVKAIQMASGLKSDRLSLGQKLQIPQTSPLSGRTGTATQQ
jgi:LysM repeat protein